MNAAKSQEITFEQAPLEYLERAASAAEDAFWLPGRQLCVVEAAAAKAVLANQDRLYEEHSDFFHTRRGPFGPRTAQVEIGRGARRLLHRHLEGRSADLAASVRRQLEPGSEWPAAGNWLVFRHLASSLAAPERPEHVRRTLREVVERAVLAGARERRSRLARAWFRRRALRSLGEAIDERRRNPAGPSRDLLDVMADSTSAEVPARDLAELYLGFVFAIAGSIGFTLGWSIYLLGTHPRTEAEAPRVVREALRLWPVAWWMARRPAQAHRIAGVEVSPRDEVIVSPYLIHRHPRYWPEPDRFLPERWATLTDQEAFLPFGWGPHTCVAASLTLDLVAEILALLTGGYELAVTPHTTRPFVGPALAPPSFRLALEPRRP